MISDLKPTTLNRYISGPQSAQQNVPVASGQPMMTVAQFLQASLNACKSPNSTTMFQRLSLEYYDQGTFFQYAQNIYNICQGLSPAQTLLSLDNSIPFLSKHTINDLTNVANQLYAMGWKGLAIGACGVTNLPNGSSTFDQICVNPPNWQPDLSTMASIQQSQPSVKEFEAQIDPPGKLGQFAGLTPDQQATTIKTLTSQQAASGFHFVYPVIQNYLPIGGTLNWDSTKIFTSQSGPFQGQSLYAVMKGLMITYN